MSGAKTSMGFLGNRHALVLSLALVAQALVFYAFSRAEDVPTPHPLSEVPAQFGSWKVASEGVIEQEVRDVLRADDIVSRVYAQSGSGRVASLFVAYFKSQRTGQAPHSPKNCLPGSGWMPSTSETMRIPIAGRAAPIQVNRYIVSKGDDKSVVIYWYQTRDRVIASEFEAKFYLVVDSIRYHRSDTALVRVVTPVRNDDEAGATQAAIEFVQAFFTPLRQFLPS
ncbi:MAG: EpsI family protein [Acidobacteria bacterium]|nr:EpsI family protein [Acidobacteriota bacterium]